MGQLSFKEVPTGVLFGFLRDISTFQEVWDTNRLIFCWDFGPSIRRTLSTEYKSNRREKTDEEKLVKLAFKRQVREIRANLLKELGYRNNFYFSNYEADDIMCRLCEILPQEDDIILVTSDKDMFQCLSPRISMYNPSSGNTITLLKFIQTYGILPDKWARVKAIAGCHSDNVAGIKGIGEKTAIKYLKNELKQTTKAFVSITENQDTIKRNMKLTKLPWPDIRTILDEDMIQKDKPNQEAWKDIAKKYGIKSLAGGGTRNGKIRKR
jgi:DNA polymerase-1